MTRWIVAGVCLAVLLVVIVSDEMSYAPGSPEIAASPDGGPNMKVFGDDTDAVAEPVEDSDVRLEVQDDCADAVARLESVAGKPYADAVGDALWAKEGATPASVATVCATLNELSSDEDFVKATVEASGIAP